MNNPKYRLYPYNYVPFASDLNGMAQVRINFEKMFSYVPSNLISSTLKLVQASVSNKPEMSSSSSSSNNIIPANVVGNVGQYAVKGFDLRACIDANGNLEVGRLQLLMDAIGTATIPRSLAEILNKAGHNIPSARITEDNNAGHSTPPAKKMRVGITCRDNMAQDPSNERGECGQFSQKWPAPFDR